jgi:hypothetical protein
VSDRFVADGNVALEQQHFDITQASQQRDGAILNAALFDR